MPRTSPKSPSSFVAGPPGFYECQCKGKAVGDKEVACGVQRPDLARAPWRQVSYHGVNATLMRHLALLVRASQPASRFWVVGRTMPLGGGEVRLLGAAYSSFAARVSMRSFSSQEGLM
jgi:hypothetical protein